MSRYIIGIDLGTTNSLIAYIDREEEIEDGPEKYPRTHIFKVPQTVDTGTVDALESLPSFLYIPGNAELPEESLSLPWSDNITYATGSFAKKRGAEVPGRLISSAKSWLCHSGADRSSPILPWNAGEGIEKMSPLDVSTAYLEHIRKAWNHIMAEDNSEYNLENQDIFLTVPASFDAVARDLTVKAAEKSGMHHVTLLEEPQAAFYSWINNRKREWRKEVKVGDVVLVCDIGGGTTDFSLIEAKEEKGDLVLNRIAVGNHILLGGDNIDLTLAYRVRQHFIDDGVKLDPQQMLGLIYNCRNAKETMLNDPECDDFQVTILGRGRSVIGGALTKELARSEVEETILDGFFPKTDINENPVEKRASGFKELGLHYAADTAVTRYLSKFLRQHVKEGDDDNRTFVHPAKILFNGGVTKASAIQERIIDVLNDWLTAESGDAVEVIEGNDPDSAVARGAAYYGFAKKEKGVRIRGGVGRAYYVGIETSMPAVPGMPPPLKAMCVVPFGMEEGTDRELPGQEFGLIVGEQAVFHFMCSSVRKDDEPGITLDYWDEEEISDLAPLETTLSGEGADGNVIPVRLHSFITELGTLELWCESIEDDRRWKLEFNVREDS